MVGSFLLLTGLCATAAAFEAVHPLVRVAQDPHSRDACETWGIRHTDDVHCCIQLVSVTTGLEPPGSTPLAPSTILLSISARPSGMRHDALHPLRGPPAASAATEVRSSRSRQASCSS